MDRKTKKNKNSWLIATGILLICIAVFCLMLFLTHGRTTVTGDFDDTVMQEKIVCESRITSYPLFTYDNSNGKSLKITAIFKDSELNSIALTYKLYYDEAEKIKQSESVNHGNLNIMSQNEGLGPDAYEATYSKLADGLQLSLYATGNEINEKALKYFMLEGLETRPYNVKRITEIYANQGLNCKNIN